MPRAVWLLFWQRQKNLLSRDCKFLIAPDINLNGKLAICGAWEHALQMQL